LKKWPRSRAETGVTRVISATLVASSRVNPTRGHVSPDYPKIPAIALV
jgi:hypothetical protein